MSSGVTICLCMIVKNESKIITRCLDSVKPIIDYVSICDTGSTDNTVKIIENWCQKNNIPGKIHHEPFKNFGYNRSLSATLAKQTYPESTYLLLIDADMILEVGNGFDKNLLNFDQYLIMQYNSVIKYWNTRLIKNSLDWECVGVTHEYWAAKNIQAKNSKLFTLTMDDRADGGCKSDKFVRDKKLLSDGINDPNTPDSLKTRYMFYLAQTYDNLHEYKESIKWYQKRIAAKGWYEEVFYSFYKIGECYENLFKKNSHKEKYFALATLNYQKAWEYRPCRAEPLLKLATLHREKGNNNLSFLYASKGKSISYPKNDTLFIDYRVYDYLLDFELSICSYYVENKREIGKQSTLNLLKIKNLPSNTLKMVIENSKFYGIDSNLIPQ